MEVKKIKTNKLKPTSTTKNTYFYRNK